LCLDTALPSAEFQAWPQEDLSMLFPWSFNMFYLSLLSARSSCSILFSFSPVSQGLFSYYGKTFDVGFLLALAGVLFSSGSGYKRALSCILPSLALAISSFCYFLVF